MPRSWLAIVVGAIALAGAATASAQRPAEPAKPGQGVAIFAGGCFWCMEPPFDKLDGVTATISGYTGGTVVNPTYEQVTTGTTGHYEAVRVEYDPTRVTYERLLEVFWHNVDPLDARGQFCDKGPQYLSAIFPSDDRQRAQAEASKAAIEHAGKLRGPIATRILPAAPFYPAEDYHQDFYRKSALKYSFYRRGCGRDARLEQVWGPPAKE